jgi:mRNA-degrading endonuclease RelE of RelBE toxin-antitoxin system
MSIERYLSFSETPVFMKQIYKTGSLDVLFEIQKDLQQDPRRGPVIKGTNGARKARVGKGKSTGKSGGFRYIYVYIEDVGTIYLLLLYGKDEQDDLTPLQKKQLGAVITRIKDALKR